MLRGPSTRVSRCSLDAAGKIVATTEIYTEYHRADAVGGSVYVVGKTADGKTDLLASGVRDQVQLAAAIEEAKPLAEEPKPADVDPIDADPKPIDEPMAEPAEEVPRVR